MVALEQGEVVIREVHKHWFFVMAQVIINVVAAFLPLFAIVALRTFGSTSQNASDLTVILVIIYPLWLLLVWISFFYFWTNYYLTVLIITNKRIIDIDQISLFDREVSTFPLENIQDMTVDVPGFLATMLDFGDVRLQTASKQTDFVIDNAAHPEIVKQTIQDAHDKILDALRSR